MARAILLVFVIVLVTNLIRIFIKKNKFNSCTNCDGQGYWQGTRGEKIFVKPVRFRLH
ncbi:MAG: hypothetical protein ACPGXZ_02725 [Saprospiraceae bacterium]